MSAGGPLVHGESSPASPEPSVQDRVEFSPPIPARAKIKAINTAVTLQLCQTKVGREAPLNQARQMRLLPLIESPS